MRRIFLFFVFFALLLAACTLPVPGSTAADDLMATVVAATMQALTPQATPPPPGATNTPQATPDTVPTDVPSPTVPGSISGNIYGYPGSGGQLTVMAFNQATGFWYYVIVQPGVFSFSISDLPAGRYQVVVYDLDDLRGGTPPTVDVVAGQNTSADVSDWSGSYPPNPNW
jgi:hypothetical protein